MKPPAEMACHEVEELVTAYLEGGLSPQERDRFEAHRQGCPGCTAYVSQLRLTVASLRQLQPSPDDDPPAEGGGVLELFRTRGLHRRGPRDRDIPLGLGSELAALGDHIVYFLESERDFDATAGFLATGAELGEACVLIGHDAANERLMECLQRRGLSVRSLMQERQLQVASVHSSADELLREVDDRIKDAVDRGMPAVRVLGTLGWGRGTPGWPSDREILRLEAHVTSTAERLPSIVVCAYDVTTLPGSVLLKGGLECHPLTFRRDSLRRNEHHVPPERFLDELAAGSG